MPRRALALALGLFACDPVVVAPAPAAPDASPSLDPRTDPEVAEMVAAVSVDEVRRTVEALVGFETRNSCSALDDPRRGIGAARDWIRARFAAVPGVDARLHAYTLSDCADGARTQSNVVATLVGAAHPERVIVVGGHYDSLGARGASGLRDGDVSAPGANDSGSQTAVLLEAARVMASHRFEATVVFVAFSGEEQGLYGSSAFVRDLGRTVPGARVEAMLDCDIVGGDLDANDDAALHQFRLYSAGTPREVSNVPQAVERQGSADDTSPSRNLMRDVGLWGARYVPSMTILPRRREDRPGRGGDQAPFLAAGIPAVRFIEANENVDRQHSPDDLAAHVSPDYIARIAQVVTAVTASLARAPLAPAWRDVRRDDAVLRFAWADVETPLRGRRVAFARSVTSDAYTARALVRGAEVSRASLAVEGAFFVTVADEDEAGHLSLWAYPEWRCDEGGCAVQPGSLDVTRARLW